MGIWDFSPTPWQDSLLAIEASFAGFTPLLTPRPAIIGIGEPAKPSARWGSWTDQEYLHVRQQYDVCSGKGLEMDVVSAERRSAMMSRIRGRDTKPELVVRRLAHALGYRFRLHRRDLPGAPDLVFPGRRKVVFVHGCFWHRHPGCRFAYHPKSNVEFWQKKFASNVERDERVLRELHERGWSPVIIWECETSDLNMLAAQLKSQLDDVTERRG